ncbi:hypothetical protein GCM10023193_27540 [Planotetraspora kaengkrachanensis]|uniref:Uncharacterized protein n=1 Tax=Planotetraspora kaengkrachanensis TaxID=575193 RepID=A0A8J3LU02_9ACTN|nr:hypothetical protein Pka01_13440 [Planotetraspora kaengkrachanensis]
MRRILAGEPSEMVRLALKLDKYDGDLITHYVGTLTAESRRAAALARLRSGEMGDSIRSDLRLGPRDVEAVARELRKTHPWLAAIAFGSDDDWQDCPGVSPHAATPQARRVELSWCDDSPGDGRSLEHTCMCVMTVYELMSYGGVYRIRRTTERRDVPSVSYAGWWRRLDAYMWWSRLLAGLAR